MPQTFDIIIIGVGPAGLSAALAALAAKPKPSVLLVDRIVPWEKPIACAEGVWTDQLYAALDVKPEWVRFKISKLVLCSADGSSVTHFAKEAGSIINRSLMQRDMAGQCKALGAEMRLNADVAGIAPESNSLRDVRFTDGTVLSSRTVIDASGPIAGFGKNEKIAWKPPDLEPAYFVVAENAGIAADEIHVHLGKSVAPGGYVWAFPRENNGANIGLVLGASYRGKVDIRKLLDSFLASNFPNATVKERHAGAIPCGGRPLPIAVSRFVKAGDAASMVNPFSRAGIMEAVISGKLAGRCACAMLEADSPEKIRAACRDYQKRWFSALGKKQERLARAKDALFSIPDADYNNAFAALSKIPPDKRSITKIIGLSLGRFPRLAFAMRHLI
ncbi:MAG TPA: NAD(P)/FAD-dependent oxidoreductase [Chitinivibrionales bacterium]|jgi:digeranylgeranylglycerophospholipid reductase|nr:NAD(P)/FAD-dependent oxidoreductase [Chitinivibrionales bacterium]